MPTKLAMVAAVGGRDGVQSGTLSVGRRSCRIQVIPRRAKVGKLVGGGHAVASAYECFDIVTLYEYFTLSCIFTLVYILIFCCSISVFINIYSTVGTLQRELDSIYCLFSVISFDIFKRHSKHISAFIWINLVEMFLPYLPLNLVTPNAMNNKQCNKTLMTNVVYFLSPKD